MSLLYDACVADNAELVRDLIDQRVDLNETNPDGYTALHIACTLGHGQCAALLIRAGANLRPSQLTGTSFFDDAPIYILRQLAIELTAPRYVPGNANTGLVPLNLEFARAFANRNVFRYRTILGDGNCLFTSLSYFINTRRYIHPLARRYDAAAARKDICDYIIDLPSTDLLKSANAVEMPNGCMLDREWGDSTVIAAAARKYRVRIIVMQYAHAEIRGKLVDTIVAERIEPLDTSSITDVWFLRYIRRAHYDVFEWKKIDPTDITSH